MSLAERVNHAYINWELAANPDELSSVRLQSLDAAQMRFADIDSVATEGIDDLEVLAEHVRVLVILDANVLFDGGREGEVHALPEGQGEDIRPKEKVGSHRRPLLATWAIWPSRQNKNIPLP